MSKVRTANRYRDVRGVVLETLTKLRGRQKRKHFNARRRRRSAGRIVVSAFTVLFAKKRRHGHATLIIKQPK